MAIVPGLSVESLAAQWEALGLMCMSSIGVLPDSSVTFYVLRCQHDDATGNVTYTASADYWTPTGVESISLETVELGEGNIADGAGASNLFLPSASLSGGDAARAWVESRINDPACGRLPVAYCDAFLGPLRPTLSVGSHGARQLDIDAGLTTQ